MTRNEFDLHGLTAELAKTLGGTDDSLSEHAMTRFTIHGGDVSLVLRKGYGSTWNKVTISAFLPFEDVLDYYFRTKIESITVTGDRGAVAIAKEINRRLLVDIDAKIAAGRAKVDAHNGQKSELTERAATYEKQFPGLKVTPNSNGQSASVYFNKNGCYLNGEMRPNGQINIQRLSLDSASQAVALLALISGQEA